MINITFDHLELFIDCISFNYNAETIFIKNMFYINTVWYKQELDINIFCKIDYSKQSFYMNLFLAKVVLFD